MATSRSATSRTATLIAAALGIAIAAGVGWGLHKASKKRSEQRAVVAIVGDTTAQLRDALKTASPEVVEKIEGNMRVAQAWSNPELSEATEHYLLGAREILRRRVEADRYEEKAAASRAALLAHMNRAARRDTPWIRTALVLKKQVERDHLELEVELRALADLLDMLPQANKRLEPHVERTLLLDDGLRKQMYRQVVDESKRATAELERTRSLLLPR
jgi:hypothetical protein